MAMSQPMTETDAYIVGVAAGWQAANYAVNIESIELDRDDADDAVVPAHYDVLAYRTGYAEGIERYTNDQWQDGSPMEDD